MAEYIKKEFVVSMLTAFENELQQYKPFNCFEQTMYRRLCEIEMEIGKSKGVAVEMVHGQWVEWYPPMHMIMTGEELLYRCSSCDAKYPDVDGYRYCPPLWRNDGR